MSEIIPSTPASPSIHDRRQAAAANFNLVIIDEPPVADTPLTPLDPRLIEHRVAEEIDRRRTSGSYATVEVYPADAQNDPLWQLAKLDSVVAVFPPYLMVCKPGIDSDADTPS